MERRKIENPQLNAAATAGMNIDTRVRPRPNAGAIAEIKPESVTFAIDGLDVNHLLARSRSSAPFASLGIAIARAVCPFGRRRSG
jgi:hypothetical protein